MKKGRVDSCKSAHGQASSGAVVPSVNSSAPAPADLSRDQVISSVFNNYNHQVETYRYRYDQLAPIMDLSEIMEPVRDFDGDDSDQEEPLLLSIETLQVIKRETPEYKCIFCKTGEVDENKLGRLFFRNGAVTHYFCMLFSAALVQQGEDADGILGFLVDDIMREARRSFRLKCIYCNKSGASIGCCRSRCKAAYHYGCGLDHGVNFQFFGNFQTYCFAHRNFQKLPPKQVAWTCTICLFEVTKDDFPNSGTVARCCANVFHRACLQTMALSAGYFFKCPTCNDTSKFIKEMRLFGIYVPEQDASWEKDDAFQDLYVQYSKCDASECECPNGRLFCAGKGDWSLARCRLCGGAGTHKFCSQLRSVDTWACHGCVKVEKSTRKKEETAQPSTLANSDQPGPSSACRQALQSTNHSEPVALVPSVAIDSTEEVNMGNLVLSSPAAEYFPYSVEDLEALQENGTTTLRDWRNFGINVNLWDLFSLIIMDHGPNDRSALKRRRDKKKTRKQHEKKRKHAGAERFQKSSMNSLKKVMSNVELDVPREINPGVPEPRTSSCFKVSAPTSETEPTEVVIKTEDLEELSPDHNEVKRFKKDLDYGHGNAPETEVTEAEKVSPRISSRKPVNVKTRLGSYYYY